MNDPVSGWNYTMDPVFYSQVNGVPQESKLATYMQNRTTPTIVNNLAGLGLEESLISVKKVTPQAPEFVPSAKSGSPNFINPFPGLVNSAPVVFNRRSSADSSLPITPRLTPQPSPPLGNCSPSLNKTPIAPVATYQENVGGTTYFYPTPANEAPAPEMVATVAPQTSYHMYPGTPSHLPTASKPSPASGFYISEDIRLETLHKNALILAQPDPEQHSDLPAEIDTYHELCPLKPGDASTNTRIEDQLFGHPLSTYKATNLKNGVKYCLRRIHGFRLPNSRCMAVVDMWKRVQHSNIVQLKEVFTTKAFNDNSMVFVYDYHPGSETLYSKHFSSSEPLNGYTDPFSSDPSAPRPYSHQKNTLLRQQHSNMLPENVIWNYIVQLTSALRVIHTAGLACRTLDPTKIILTSPTRLRLSCLGIADVITFDGSAAVPLQLIPHYQQEDLTALGKVILALACRSLMAVQHDNIQTSIDLIARTYSTDLRNFVTYLLTNQSHHPPAKSATDLMPMIGARFYTHLDQLQLKADMLHNELAKEMENGRLARLMVKLATINERPEHNLDPTWSETGDRYMLKLFRDYVFHQVTEDGRPWLDMAHVVQCLNKLDVGSTEKVSLMSRDEQSILVVSYVELKHCLEQSFGELLLAAKPEGML